MSDPQTQFVLPLADCFEAPPQGRKFLARLAVELAEFSDAALTEGARALIRTRKTRAFPTVAECIEACRDPRALTAQARAAKGRKPVFDEAVATRMLQSEIGRRAGDEGWIAELYQHLRRTGRHPSDDEARAMRERVERMRGCDWYKQSKAAIICKELRELAYAK